MFVYIDETGSTGLNIFDTNQDTLMSAAVVARFNFDSIATLRHTQILNRISCAEIHANELGVARINEISHRLKKVVLDFKLRFACTKVEKRYLAISKLFDTLFDSFENVAVPWHVYNIGVMRLIMMFKLNAIVTEEHLVNFWNCCMLERKRAIAQSNFVDLCNSIKNNVNVLPDARSRQIISEALSWAAAHSEAISFQPANEQIRLMNSPNFVAFSSLIPAISMMAARASRKVRGIVHDEQSQFGRVFNYYHQSMQNAGVLNQPRVFGVGRLDFRPLQNSSLDMRDSASSFGLQVADIYLFLQKKAASGVAFRGDIACLYKVLDSRTIYRNLNFEDVYSRVSAEYQALMSADITPEMERRGRELLNDIEQRRQRLMEAADVRQ